MCRRLPITRCRSCKTSRRSRRTSRRFDLPASISRATEHSTRSISARVRFSVAKTGNKQSAMYTKRCRRRNDGRRERDKEKERWGRALKMYRHVRLHEKKKRALLSRVGAGCGPISWTWSNSRIVHSLIKVPECVDALL